MIRSIKISKESVLAASMLRKSTLLITRWTQQWDRWSDSKFQGTTISTHWSGKHWWRTVRTTMTNPLWTKNKKWRRTSNTSMMIYSKQAYSPDCKAARLSFNGLADLGKQANKNGSQTIKLSMKTAKTTLNCSKLMVPTTKEWKESSATSAVYLMTLTEWQLLYLKD